MEQRRYDFLLEATQPIIHLRESVGNHGIIARRKIWVKNRWATVPVVSGNQMRHKLRNASTWCLLDALGLIDSEALTESATRLLFNGGELTKKKKGDAKSGSGINFESYRTLTEMIPTIALLGGCANGQINEGQGAVDPLLLICDESWDLLPDWVHDHYAATGMATDSARAFVEEIQNVRCDSSNTSKRVQRLLTQDEQVNVNTRLLARSTAHDDGEDTSDDAKLKMLPYTSESLAMGSVFYWSLVFTIYNELQLDTLHTMMGAFLRNPNVGGKVGSGHGNLRIITARNIRVARPSEVGQVVEVDTLAPKIGSTFYKHVRDRADRIKEYLQAVQS